MIKIDVKKSNNKYLEMVLSSFKIVITISFLN
jgi:hypothetical protein